MLSQGVEGAARRQIPDHRDTLLAFTKEILAIWGEGESRRTSREGLAFPKALAFFVQTPERTAVIESQEIGLIRHPLQGFDRALVWDTAKEAQGRWSDRPQADALIQRAGGEEPTVGFPTQRPDRAAVAVGMADLFQAEGGRARGCRKAVVCDLPKLDRGVLRGGGKRQTQRIEGHGGHGSALDGK